MLKAAVDWLTYTLLGLDVSASFAQTVNFFVYDTIKILFLLLVMISFIGFLRSFLREDRLKAWIMRRGLLSNLAASCFGAVTPFCSCSSIPIFLGFLRAGVPLGVVFSFLVTSPLINEYLVVLMFGFFGWKVTVVYIVSGIFLGVAVGVVMGHMNLTRYITEDFTSAGNGQCAPAAYSGLWSRVRFGITEAYGIIRKAWAWILFGVGLGAFIHNYIPARLIQGIIEKTGFAGVPLATALGTPMYGSCAAIVPVAVALFRKGIPLGTALAFMMATSALSLPEAVILRRAMKLKLIIIFFTITIIGIIFTGYLMNFAQKVISV